MTYRVETDRHRQPLPHHCPSQPEMHVWWCAQWLGFSGQTWGTNSVWLYRDSWKGLDCGLGHNWVVHRMETGSFIGASLSTCA